jgi:hypothetical protein
MVTVTIPLPDTSCACEAPALPDVLLIDTPSGGVPFQRVHRVCDVCAHAAQSVEGVVVLRMVQV